MEKGKKNVANVANHVLILNIYKQECLTSIFLYFIGLPSQAWLQGDRKVKISLLDEELDNDTVYLVVK